MADINTVLKAWECCNPLNRRCFKCPYEAICFHDSFDRVAIADMVRLLEEQRAEIEKMKERLEKTELCDRCGRRRLKSTWGGR